MEAQVYLASLQTRIDRIFDCVNTIVCTEPDQHLRSTGENMILDSSLLELADIASTEHVAGVIIFPEAEIGLWERGGEDGIHLLSESPFQKLVMSFC